MDLTIRISAGVVALACLPLGAHAVSLTVTVDAVRDDAGKIYVCLFTKPDRFPDCGADVTAAIRAAKPSHAPRTVFQFDNLSPGIYAATSFHDEKGSGRLETNFLGIPRGGVGASNDARGHFGPPRFADAAFSLGMQNAAIALTLVYP